MTGGLGGAARPTQFFTETTSNRDPPPIISRRRRQPYYPVPSIQITHQTPGRRRIMPSRISRAVEEAGAVAGILRVDIHGPGEQGGTANAGGSQLQPRAHRQPVCPQRAGDQTAEQRAFRVYLAGNRDRRARVSLA